MLGPARRRAACDGPPRPLVDGSVALDRFTDADIGAVWAGEDDQFVLRSCLPGPFSEQDVAHRIAEWQRQWCFGGSRRAFAIREAAARRLVGGCVLEIGSADRESAELSYWVFPRYRGRGYATRAARLACTYAFHDLGLTRVVLHIEPTNEASLGVAAAAGFVRRRGRGGAGWPGMLVFSRCRRGGRRSESSASLPRA